MPLRKYPTRQLATQNFLDCTNVLDTLCKYYEKEQEERIFRNEMILR